MLQSALLAERLRGKISILNFYFSAVTSSGFDLWILDKIRFSGAHRCRSGFIFFKAGDVLLNFLVSLFFPTSPLLPSS